MPPKFKPFPDFIERENKRQHRAIIHTAKEGNYWAEVPALTDCITEGDSMAELLENLQDVI
ncbi:type II toxin-antitoxin system HicB family antitoxin [Synechococcus moorigangaii CMS01]|nr:type II toxin-antitoxin system HicB family antitoxin [Synechococcus moorigangaii CMS01]